MMDDFREKWHNDKKYQAKIKLSLYAVFIAIVFLLVTGQRNTTYENKIDTDKIDTSDNAIIEIPSEYHYTIDINIDDTFYKYYGDKLTDKQTITKEKDDTIYNYTYENNTYYYQDENIYVKTTKEEVYDIINENYINIDNINNYLSKSIKNGNQYLIYLKDIILNYTTDEYFTILINDNRISIDYTPLIKRNNENIEKCNVDITIENIE